VVLWDNSPKDRYPLSVAISRDGCKSWSSPRVVAAGEGGQASYPSVTQAPDGTIVAVWQQELPNRKGREIRAARFNRAWLLEH
jgi:BNR repeat-like domain